jgi:hypothetical protein
MLGWRDRVGRGIWRAKPKTKPPRLGFGLVRANGKGAHGGGPFGAVDVVVDVLGTCNSAGSGRNAKRDKISHLMTKLKRNVQQTYLESYNLFTIAPSSL